MIPMVIDLNKQNRLDNRQLDSEFFATSFYVIDSPHMSRGLVPNLFGYMHEVCTPARSFAN